jgi:Arc/MetJ-type ribon-helix-helix transcriptional regulator
MPEKVRMNIRFERGMQHRMKELIAEGKYFSMNEFIRTAIKEKINKEEG